MKGTGKYIRYLLFWGIFAVILFYLSILLEPKENSEEAGVALRDTKGMLLMGEPKETIDVYFFGDSITFTGISPMQMWEDTGMTSYVCGQSGQKIVEVYFWLRELYDAQTPEVVVLETNTLYNGEGAVFEADYGLGETIQYYVPAVKYHNRWKNLHWNDLKKKPNYKERDLFKGFEIKREVEPYSGGTYMQETGEKQKTDVISMYYLDKVKTFCEKREIELLLVSVPSPDSWNMEQHNAVAEYAEKQKLTYLDMNLYLEEIGIDWQEDTMDSGIHLNCAGAKKVSGYMGNYLAEHYKLTDHREDRKYKSWEKDLKRYREVAPDVTDKGTGSES